MLSLVRASSLLFPIALLLPAPAGAQQVTHAPSARPIQPTPIEVQIGGAGAGTLVLPSAHPGSARALLADAGTGLVLQLEAELIPYAFLVEHPPAGAIQGGLYTIVDPESTDEPVLVAEVLGEWTSDDVGDGLLRGLFVHSNPGGEPAIVGALEATFHIQYSRPPVIAPPFYLADPEPISVSPLSVARAPLAHSAPLAGSDPAPTRLIRSVVIADEARPAELAPVPPTVVVDEVPSALVARMRIVWSLVL